MMSAAAPDRFSASRVLRARYNRGVNAPAIRTVAERPSAVTRCSRVWLMASSQIGSQVTSLRLPFSLFRPDRRLLCPCLHRDQAWTRIDGRASKLLSTLVRLAWYNESDDSSPMNCSASVVRSSPPKAFDFRRTAGHQGLTLPVVLLTSQVHQLENVVTDRQRVSHDTKDIVHDTQEMVGKYHFFSFRAYWYESARRCYRRAAFARRQARHTPRKPQNVLRFLPMCCTRLSLNADRARSIKAAFHWAKPPVRFNSLARLHM